MIHDIRAPILRTMPGPTDINANGHIFGGWVLSQMDIAGGLLTAQISKGPCATIAIESMKFVAPILLHDIVSVYGQVKRRGRTSVSVEVTVTATRGGKEEVLVTEGLFTFVAIDKDGRPRPLPPEED